MVGGQDTNPSSRSRRWGWGLKGRGSGALLCKGCLWLKLVGDVHSGSERGEVFTSGTARPVLLPSVRGRGNELSGQ